MKRRPAELFFNDHGPLRQKRAAGSRSEARGRRWHTPHAQQLAHYFRHQRQIGGGARSVCFPTEEGIQICANQGE